MIEEVAMERRWERKCRGARRGEASLASLHEWPRHNNNDTAWRRRPRLPGEIGLLFCGVPSSARSPPRPPPQGKREIGQKRTRSAYSQTTFPSSSAASEQPSPTQYFYSPRGGPPAPDACVSAPLPNPLSPPWLPPLPLLPQGAIGRGKGGRSLDLRPQLTQHKRSAPLPRFSFPPFMPLEKGVGKRRPPYRPIISCS